MMYSVQQNKLKANTFIWFSFCTGTFATFKIKKFLHSLYSAKKLNQTSVGDGVRMFNSSLPSV